MNREELQDIYEEYSPLVWAMIGKMGIRSADREDVFMASWEAIFSSIDSFGGESRLSTWIARIVRNKSVDYIRGRHPVPLDGEDLEYLAESMAHRMDGIPGFLQGTLSPRENVIRDEAARLVRTVLDELPPQRKFIIEKWMVGFSYREIAELVNAAAGDPVDVNYVGKQIYAAKIFIAGALTGRGIKSWKDLLE